MSTVSIEEALRANTPDLIRIPGVVGTGQGLCDGKPCIKVFAVKRTPELDNRIPEELDGYPVVIEETGQFRASPGKAGEEGVD